MPAPLNDLGDPVANLLLAFWDAVRTDLRGEAPVFGQVASHQRGLPAEERATIEKETARQNAEEFVISPSFNWWVYITSEVTGTQLDPDTFRKALYGDR